MKRRRPEQLALPGSLLETVQVREELVRADYALAEVTAELEQARKEISHLRAKLQQATQRAEQAEHETALASLRLIELRMQLLQYMQTSPRASAPGLDAAIVRRLLALSHPDKWSQGQPAIELAHELTVHLNALRQPRGEVAP